MKYISRILISAFATYLISIQVVEAHPGNVRKSDCTHSVRGTSDRHKHTGRRYCGSSAVKSTTGRSSIIKNHTSEFAPLQGYITTDVGVITTPNTQEITENNAENDDNFPQDLEIIARRKNLLISPRQAWRYGAQNWTPDDWESFIFGETNSIMAGIKTIPIPLSPYIYSNLPQDESYHCEYFESILSAVETFNLSLPSSQNDHLVGEQERLC